ncbi:phospholipase D-like domain-containing protein [Longimicrobium sp.]|uniref:phospholipase D-like domain-containing protein n=1 Tax=Longimicrobium sp. TaxID=2029185 RepID=UPI003B3B146B
MCLAIAFAAGACEDIPYVVMPASDGPTLLSIPSPPYAVSTWGHVRVEAHFTDLSGGVTEDRSILNHVIYLINNAPGNSEIRAAIFTLNDSEVRQALERAHTRGVRVFVAMDGSHHPADPMDDESITDPEVLEAYLNQPGGPGSRFRWCTRGGDTATAGWDGCIAKARGAVMHSKLFLFTHTRDASGARRTFVTWFGSANLSPHSGSQTYNNTVTVYGDRKLYNGFMDEYWTELWEGRTKYPGNDFFDRPGPGFFIGNTFGLRVFASPQQQTDLVEQRIRSVEGDSDCVIHVAQSTFNEERNAVARMLAKKRSYLCRVYIAVGSMDTTTYEALQGVKKKIPVWCINTHDKFILIRGRHEPEGPVRRMVFTGSHNLTRSGNYVNDELLVRVEDDTIYSAFLQSWSRMTYDEDAIPLHTGGSC